MKIKYCKKCSNVDEAFLKEQFPDAIIKEKCVDVCKNKEDRFFVKFKGEIIKAKSKERLVEKIKAAKED